VAGLVAGAMAMSAGEYVFSSQSDTEHADLASERRQLLDGPEFEEGELAQIYVARGVEAGLACQVAQQLMAKDALSARMPGMSLPFRSPIAPLGYRARAPEVFVHLRRAAERATPASSTGHAPTGAKTVPKLTSPPDHSVVADHD